MRGLIFVGSLLVAATATADEAKLANAVEQGNTAVALRLLQDGVEVDLTQVDGTTALQWACYRDDPELAI